MAYDPKRDTCANCIHFEADPEDAEEAGACHRYPPSYIPRLHIWDFAAVVADNTCGEFDSLISDDHDLDQKIRH